MDVESLKAAYDEAGHVVWSWSRNVDVFSTSIEPGLSQEGGEYRGVTDRMDGPTTPVEEADFYLAGLAGLRIGSERRGYEVEDLLSLRDMRDAIRHLYEAEGYPSLGPTELELRYVPMAEERLDRIQVVLRENPKLEQIANALLTERKLDHERLQKLKAD